MAHYGEWEDEGWRGEWREHRGERAMRPGERGSREPWREDDEWSGERRAMPPEERWYGGERDRGYREGERDWRERRDWDPRRGYGERSGERWGARREIDPPWVEMGPEARRRGSTRGMVEWEDRGPLAWLGDKIRGATGGRKRGPKGYKRSDERIADDVCERISRSGVDAGEVTVKVEKGEVTLGGTVRSRAEKWRLEEVADDVFGVEDVHNEVRVSRMDPETEATRRPDVRH